MVELENSGRGELKLFGEASPLPIGCMHAWDLARNKMVRFYCV